MLTNECRPSLSSRWRQWGRAWLVVGSLAVLTGCAQQRLRDEAQTQLRAGQYEQALTHYEAALQKYPNSTILRAGQLQARNETISRLIADASAARSAGQYAQAQALLQRAKTLDPANKRVDNLLSDLATEQRQRAALLEAEQLVSARKAAAALKVIEHALKDNPRHTELLNLQRRLEIDVRQAQVRNAQSGLMETRPISLDFRDAGLRTVLDVVSRNSGINFILDKDIRPDTRVTVFLRSAKVEDAIDLIVSTNQLSKKVIDRQTLLIYPNTPDKQREHQEQVVKVFYLASAEAKGAAAFLKSMLKIREPHVDERTNMLALRDSAENVQLAERLIALYDAQEPEVMLEVEVLEISSSRLTDLGVKFPESFSLAAVAPGGATNLTLGNVSSVTRDDIRLSIGGVTVNLRREVGDFNTLANPRIRAKNKEKAKIMIGDKVPIITATTGVGGFVSDSVSYVDVGLKLDVEPTIYADDNVAIRLAMEVSTLSKEIRTQSGTLAYQIGTRNATTMLQLRDGETQILAGLISREDRSNASRVPGLGDLPVLGRVFSSQLDNTLRTELVLAITPRIIRNLRRPDVNETELWIGTEALPRMRPVEGRLASLTEETPSVAGLTGAPQRAAAAPPADTAAPVPPPKPAAVGPVGLTWVAPSEVKVGEKFVATLMLNTPAELRGAPVQLSFTPKTLSIDNVDEGDLFRQDGASTSFTQVVDVDVGRIQLGALRNQATGISGQGAIVSLQLTATASGVAEIKVLGIQPLGVAGEAAPVPLPPALRVKVQ